MRLTANSLFLFLACGGGDLADTWQGLSQVYLALTRIHYRLSSNIYAGFRDGFGVLQEEFGNGLRLTSLFLERLNTVGMLKH